MEKRAFSLFVINTTSILTKKEVAPNLLNVPIIKYNKQLHTIQYKK